MAGWDSLGLRLLEMPDMPRSQKVCCKFSAAGLRLEGQLTSVNHKYEQQMEVATLNSGKHLATDYTPFPLLLLRFCMPKAWIHMNLSPWR